MAIVSRLTNEFTSNASVTYQVSVVDTDSPSSATSVVNLGDNGFDLTYQTDTDDRFTGVIPSEVVLDVFVTVAFEQAVINAIRIADYKRFQLKIEKKIPGGSYELFWIGNILNDINAEKDEGFPRQFTLTAICGLSQLSEITYTEDINYLDISTYETFEIIRNALKLQIGTSANWGGSDTYLYTVVDWTNDLIPRSSGVDPLGYTRFNPFAFATTDPDTGIITRQSAFELLNGICKAWGARLFQSDGYWHFIQVNSYHYMGSATDVFFRTYKTTGTIFNFGTVDYRKTEGSTYTRLAGATFDTLPILRQVSAKYDTIKAFDLPFLTYQYGSGTETDFTSSDGSKPIITWNGYMNGPNPVEESTYDMATGIASCLKIKLGDVSAITGGTISFKRVFSNTFNLSLADYITAGWGNSSFVIRHYVRLRLVGSSDTKLCVPLGTNASDWTVGTVSSSFFNLAPSFPNALTPQLGSIYYNPINAEEYLVEFETQELPNDGTLFLDTYSIVKYYDINTPASQTIIQSSDTSADKIFIFSRPDTNDEQHIQYYVNGEAVAGQIFQATNTPGGTLIDNGTEYEVGDLFFGSGPDAAAIGKIESFNGSVWSNAINATWDSYGSGTDYRFTQLLTEEILKGQDEGAGIFNGSIKITNTSELNYFNSLSIDGKYYLPSQMSFNANHDTWSGEYYEVIVNSNTQGFSITDLPLGKDENKIVGKKITSW